MHRVVICGGMVCFGALVSVMDGLGIRDDEFFHGCWSGVMMLMVMIYGND